MLDTVVSRDRKASARHIRRICISNPQRFYGWPSGTWPNLDWSPKNRLIKQILKVFLVVVVVVVVVVVAVVVVVKIKASSLGIAPLTILDSGALQPRKWQLIGNDCSTVAQAVAAPEPALTDYWAHSCSQQAYYAPVNHARPSPRNPYT